MGPENIFIFVIFILKIKSFVKNFRFPNYTNNSKNHIGKIKKKKNLMHHLGFCKKMEIVKQV